MWTTELTDEKYIKKEPLTLPNSVLEEWENIVLLDSPKGQYFYIKLQIFFIDFTLKFNDQKWKKAIAIDELSMFIVTIANLIVANLANYQRLNSQKIPIKKSKNSKLPVNHHPTEHVFYLYLATNH